MNREDTQREKTYPFPTPEWYWKKGLHDAHILNKILLPTDELPTTGYIANGLELRLDSSMALFDTKVCAIRFYNYKELTSEVLLEDSWWTEDLISREGNKFLLQLRVLQKKKWDTYRLRFESCEVIRLR